LLQTNTTVVLFCALKVDDKIGLILHYGLMITE